MAPFFAWIARIPKQLRNWYHAQGVMWEERHIIQYHKQIADALAGIEDAKKRRAAAEARRQR